MPWYVYTHINAYMLPYVCLLGYPYTHIITATHCNALQRTSTHCNALQHTAAIKLIDEQLDATPWKSLHNYTFH